MHFASVISLNIQSFAFLSLTWIFVSFCYWRLSSNFFFMWESSKDHIGAKHQPLYLETDAVSTHHMSELLKLYRQVEKGSQMRHTVFERTFCLKDEKIFFSFNQYWMPTKVGLLMILNILQNMHTYYHLKKNFNWSIIAL